MKSKDEYIFGIRSTIEAITSGKEIEKILFKKNLKGELYYKLLSLLKNLKIPYQYVPVEKLNKITRKNHQGVIAYISPIEYSDIEEILPASFEKGKLPLILILEKITDVRNFGAIVRTAECAGTEAIVVPDKGSARINADAVKTSAGGIYSVPICRTGNLKSTIRYLKDCGLQIIAATEKSEIEYYSVDFSLPTGLLLGSEDKGISEENLKLADKLVRIPVFGKIESLNVASAASILIYELIRQRAIFK